MECRRCETVVGYTKRPTQSLLGAGSGRTLPAPSFIFSVIRGLNAKWKMMLTFLCFTTSDETISRSKQASNRSEMVLPGQKPAREKVPRQ